MDNTLYDPFAADTTLQGSGVPAYITAADSHNIANVGASWFDVDPTNIPKFAAVSVMSGLNSVYNTGVKVGNFLGGDFDENDTNKWISSIDDNLGQYYSENKTAADLTGFALTSMIPGMAGVKILNAGQKILAAGDAGFVGSNLGLALGLRTPQIETYIATAANEIRNGQAAFAGISASGFKALATGTYQNVLEGLAFETAVQTTMQASPVLTDQSKSDVLWNLATGGFLGGVIGGGLGAIKTLQGVKKGVQALDESINPFGSRALIADGNTPANKIILNSLDLEHGPVLNPGDPDYIAQVKALNERQTRILLDRRSEVGNLTGGDNSLRNMIADHLHGQSADDVMAAVIDTDQIGRISTPTKIEAARNLAQKEIGVVPDNLVVQYWKLTGDNMGDVLGTTPVVSNLADRFPETSYAGTKSKVLDYVRDQGFKIGDLWDAGKTSLGANGHLNAEARYIWADKIPGQTPLLAEVPEGSLVHKNDFPILQRALKDNQFKITVVGANGKLVQDSFSGRKELQDFIVKQKQDVQVRLQSQVLKNTNRAAEQGDNPEYAHVWTSNKISKITDTPINTLEATGVTGDATKDYFARDNAETVRNNYLASKGLKPVTGEENNPDFLPTWAKVTKNVSSKVDLDGNEVDGYTYLKMQNQLWQDDMSRVVAKQAGPYAAELRPELLSERLLGTASSIGTGPGMLKINNPGYDSLGSSVSLLGSVTSRLQEWMTNGFKQETEGPLASLARNREASIEWDSLQQKASRSAQQFKLLDQDGIRGLVSKAALKNATDEAGEIDGQMLHEFLDDPKNSLHYIPVETDEAWDVANAHVSRTDLITGNRNERAAASGIEQAKEVGIFRPIPADPKDYPFFAFVKDPKVTGQGHTSMIFAQSDSELQALANKALQARPDLEVHFKSDTEAFYKARGDYSYDRTLSENYIDSDLKNAGVYSNYFTKTDPESIVNQFLNYHTRQLASESREIVRGQYQAQFDWLEDQANAFSRTATSKFGGNFDALEAQSSNPYLSYIKTALNISRAQESPLWYGFNKMLDSTVSKAVDHVRSLWDSAGNIGVDELGQINDALQKYGMNTGYYDAATNGLVNCQASKGALSSFVRTANGILSRLVLSLDPLNSLVNTMGGALLRTTELGQLTDAIKSGNTDIAGKLAELSHIDVTGQGDMIMSPAKLMARAMKDFISPDKEGLNELYKQLGLSKGIREIQQSAMDDLTLTGSEDAAALTSKWQNALQKVRDITAVGEKVTGNKLAEEFNRFVSARSMQLLTQPGVDSGLFSQAEQYAYMNTFVNRVEGNILAAQRPMAFSGPIGQAIGLFQSYQFNMMQQMFRYVAEGSTKDAAMLLGLQGTFFGAQSLPAFQAINQHIIGTASGNVNHTDLYDATYGTIGKQAGDLLLYGLPSKLLQTNIYGRGDINPRSVTVLPTTPADIPFISAFTKFAGTMKDMATNISGGGNVWESILQGIEHNGINRPLAGLAQTLQATTGNGTPYSTTGKGDIMFSNDLLSLATLSRLSGGRPLQEAIINDGLYRDKGYAQVAREKMQDLADSVKVSNIEGQEMSSDQVSNFSKEYAALGGKQVQFNQFMTKQIKSANTSQAQLIVSQLQNPFNQKMQLLMGTASGGGSLATVSQLPSGE